MISFLDQARIYALYHQNPINRYMQFIVVPLTILTWMILLACVHVSIPGLINVNMAAIASAVLLIYYFKLNWRLTLTITPLFIMLWWIASCFSDPTPSALTLIATAVSFVLCCLIYVAGQFMEGKCPSIVDALLQTFVAPLLIAAEIYFIAGKMRDLKHRLYGQD